jgi:hypothetical protein
MAFKVPKKETPAGGKGDDVRVSKDEVAKEAYYRWQKRGGKHGDHMRDWLEAEREVKTRKAQGR